MTTPPQLPSLSDFEDEPELLGIQPRARSAREPGQPATSPTLRPRREAPAALEASADRLPHLMEDRPVTGGSLFKARSAHVSRSAEPLTNLNFRLLVEDFEILDQLVLRVNAPSRSQLVTAALIAYLNEGSPT